ncbi:MAG: hypothetical protein COT85_05865 [Chlamydiae bacterium CG10_big_fil_rev_8_21_14_0_10_42_34]|nr:MAG: hypothetical protein COT85_05865 [Chlamydiae bacterium CG10_big_fil_rev_8_21_14_0_10_42_34]
MSIEGCDLYSEEQYDSSFENFSVQSKWNGHLVVLENSKNQFSKTLCRDLQVDKSWKNREISPMGKIGGSAGASSDTDGNSLASGEVSVSANDDDGNTVSVSAGGSIRSDSEGNISAEGRIETKWEYEF